MEINFTTYRINLHYTFGISRSKSDWYDIVLVFLQDGAIIGSGAQILGPITIGSNARVGANSVNKIDKSKIQSLFGIFLYVVGTIFIYRYLSL